MSSVAYSEAAQSPRIGATGPEGVMWLREEARDSSPSAFNIVTFIIFIVYAQYCATATGPRKVELVLGRVWVVGSIIISNAFRRVGVVGLDLRRPRRARQGDPLRDPEQRREDSAGRWSLTLGGVPSGAIGGLLVLQQPFLDVRYEPISLQC